MAPSELTIEQIYEFLIDNGCKVRNRDAVRHFKRYLTDPTHKEQNRTKFKQYVNQLAHTKTEDDEKVLILKTKYLSSLNPPPSPASPLDPMNSVGIPLSPTSGIPPEHVATGTPKSSPRQPPPYRAPPPVSSPSTTSLDSISLGSTISLNTQETTPQAPPRKREIERKRPNGSEEVTPTKKSLDGENEEKQKISVKERTQKFNRMASSEDELSPRPPKSAEKEKSKWGAEEDEDAQANPLEQKKCVEWYVTASKGDLQELLKLAKEDPRLVNRKDPFTAYTVLHWGAKHGNDEIIKLFAGKYKVDVNSLTNGGYTPLHISAQFGHKDLFKLLIEVYKADTKIRDYSGRTAEFYLLAKEQKENSGVTLRKIKGRKKQSEKDLGFLRIGSLNVRVKKTTEAFSNFLGVGSSGAISPLDTMSEKVHKGWGSADNLSKDTSMGAPKGYNISKKKSRRTLDASGVSSTPSTPKTPTKVFSSLALMNDSDSDTAAGFDSNWKN